MAIIPIVGRKKWSMRLLIAMLYVVLTIGAITMVYPFLVMLSTSVKSGSDVNDYAVFPKYFNDNSQLFAKFAEAKFAGDINVICDYYGAAFPKLENVVPPQTGPLTHGQKALVSDWNDFCKGMPPIYKESNFGMVNGTAYAPSKLLDAYRAWLRKKFNNDINALNRKYLETNISFEMVFSPFERTAVRQWQPGKTPKVRDWQKFLSTLPEEYHRVVGCDASYVTFLRVNKYEGDIKAMNAAYGTKYTDFPQVHLSTVIPTNPKERADWEEYVRTILPFRFMSVSGDAAPAYREFLSKKYTGNITLFNRAYNTNISSFDQIGIPKQIPTEGTPVSDWNDFITKAVPITSIKALNAENIFRQNILDKYGSLSAINKAYGLKMTSIGEFPAPYSLADWDYVLGHRNELRKNFVTRNYSTVLSFMLLHGRAVLNTGIYCLAVILTTLTVNPLCAYALSRYNLKYAYKVLLFLLATMAFPAEVAAIPNFLLLKNLHLLNTFWALILPGMAGGFAIFLLKGFFDSLPRELYEAGIIDGASEPTMFWKITIPLSKPIFAVIALQAFVAAYGAFMFAFLVCQNPKMWTMMVWLYELQITAPRYITMAALTLAAMPTLLVFIFAQNIIMRGIILPSYK